MANTVANKDLHRIVLTAIIYNDEGKYLITKRPPTQKAFPNKWTVPGGGVEAEDYLNKPKTTAEAWYGVLPEVLKREVKEEVNLEIDKIEYLVDMFFVRPDGVPVLVISYFAHHVSGEVVLEAEAATEYAWVTAEEAASYDLIDGILKEIQDIDTILKNRG
jgi:8-oxo-dGTP pyrophosphatase MutT (NUDIX family)